jgi:crotonobetainyl-CoA:carnitine CoA-transferase CaiB-like acyl-CoA transferase
MPGRRDDRQSPLTSDGRRGAAPSQTSEMLTGIRVVELGMWVAGPAAGGVLSDWGADVIKVEPPEGDPQRRVFRSIGLAVDTAPPFELDNRGKRSVALDLRTEEGREAMTRLVATADVFLTNLRPDALERLGLDHGTLLARHPRLVYASVTGYGLNGPERDRPGYDIGAFWARSGMAAALVPKDEMPPHVRSGVGDHTTGITAVAGIMAALFERERSGQGRLVATSLLRTGIYTMGWDIGIFLRFGRIQSARKRDKFPAPLLNVYRAGDAKSFWLIGLEQDRHWPGLLAAIERPDLAADERFATAAARVKECEALISELDEVFAARPRDEWARAFDTHDVWWSPVNTIADVVVDPQAVASGAFVDMPVVDGEPPYQAVASPIDFGDERRPAGSVPAIGQHTAGVLRELGL